MNEDQIIDMGHQSGELYLNEQARGGLKTAASWAMGLSILGFIGVGFMFLAGVIMLIFSGFMSGLDDDKLPFPFWIISLFYILIGGLYLMPVLYLYQFSTKMKRALLHNDNFSLTESCVNLGKHYKFLGLMIVAIFGLYIAMIVVMMLFGLFGTGRF